MMSKKGRITKSRDYKEVFEKGESVATRGLVLYRIPNNLQQNRAGFIASKKVGNAVVRNRVRRLLKEAFRSVTGELAGSYDMVFIARPQTAAYDYAQAATEMKRVLQRGGLFTIHSPRNPEKVR